jgi:glycosyltransferase involved in cell wall biosynthesis
MNDSNHLKRKNSDRYRILYTQKPTGGGSTIALYELVKGLDTNKYEPIILFLQKNKYIENFNELGIKTLSLDVSESEKKRQHRNRSFLGKIYQLIAVDIPLGIHISKILKKEKIDLIHLNTGFDRPVMVAANISKTPKVFHFRNFNERIPFILKLLTSSIDAALYTTQAIADSYINIGITVTKSDIVYEPIDIKKFSKNQDISLIQQQFSITKSNYIVSNIGRITPWKGQHYFLQAMEDIIRQYPDTKAFIVGEPGETEEDKEYFNLLQYMSQKTSLNGHVFLTGKRNDIAEIMSLSDIVVHSSSKPEPFGLVIAEAMATGTPVIATQGGGPIEIIKNGITGLLVPMKSATGIKEAIQKLFESKVLRKTISVNARKDVTERFPIQRHVAKVQKTYEDILKKPC